jgi:adenylate cyclase
MAYKLVFRHKDRLEERPLAGRTVRLGRDRANEVAIDAEDRSVSRFHARLDFDGQHWRITDTKSTNRVRVNGDLIEPEDKGTRVLADGDGIALGGFEMRLVREESEGVVLDKGQVEPRSLRTRAPAVELANLTGLIKRPQAAALPQDAAEALDRAEKALSVITGVGRRIAAVTPVDDILDAIVELVFEATPAERVALFLWEDEAGRLVPKRTRSRAGEGGGPLTLPETLVRKAFAEKAVVQLDPQENISQSMVNLRLRSALAVPMADEAKAVGVIYTDTALLAGAFDPFSVALLSALASHAAIALEQTRLLRRARQEERNRAKLERYLARPVVNRIISSGESMSGFSMRAEEVEVTVLFCDMAGFTSRTENMPPHEVLVLLNRCFSAMAEVILAHEGTLDKYIGDCIMAVFGAPQAQPDHARRAAITALGLREAIRLLNAEGTGVEVGFRIGMHSGRAVAGDVGHVTRRDWTVMGSTVNLASRMESSVARPGQIVLTGETRAGLGDEFALRRIEVPVPPKGIARGFEAYELLGRAAPQASPSPA